ncbi:ankyrin repeat domain-containing protein [Pseudomonas sp. R5(2019)]|uniref:ankyrin repeat domain-containing protein n=1 Tax=Pseudomonas sp. R5(2019) TaxID=2697566 RepID=UPI0021151044|nr:ankyrin repeat domain-containing protein [Pseudomonas sp. R5(2019)]
MDRDKNKGAGKSKNSPSPQPFPSSAHEKKEKPKEIIGFKKSVREPRFSSVITDENYSEEDIRRLQEEIFIHDAKEGKIEEVEEYLQSGMNVNVQDKLGMTALQHAAATGFRPCIRLLVNSGKCNYLLKDNKGRLASELAYEWGRDYAVGLLLQKKEAMQAYLESLQPSPDTSGDESS